MEPLTLTNSDQINKILAEITLSGPGFSTVCLLDNTLDAGLSEPDFLKAEGEDPDAYYQGKPNAWANYHIRQSKKIFLVYKDPGKERRLHFTQTP